ncbi:hypothetical protein [Flavihumibacter solisilvae]|uniref:Uncharacterized protein n=1 Tax=Flavihumibacter solisilvae TaxID=1349421 RepID=A0A0C1INM0_9BACT|nr:hypothetical protein [Flavihumibacter solisilvae]KIC95840.1 hypothetical protein OI18_04200 [Flavihumibacter solisilvae]
MKIALSALVVIVAVVAAAFSEPASFTLQVKAESNEAFILQVENPAKKRLWLTIRHSGTGPVVDTMICSPVFRCRYIMSDVEDGNYEVSVTDGKFQASRNFELATKTIVRRDLVVKE